MTVQATKRYPWGRIEVTFEVDGDPEPVEGARIMAANNQIMAILKALGEPEQTYEQWQANNPAARRAHDLAHGWGVRDGATLPEVLKAHPEAAGVALHRMRSAIGYYLGELQALIDSADYSEIKHHAGHIEFEAKSIGELVLAQWAVMREAGAQKGK